jgi:LysR family nitrogen assimilation transcriptional regulator
MDIRQLRYFVKAVESGSLTHAARALHVAQPALSLHMRNLEEELGVTLLERSKRGVVPTDHGKLLLEHARNILRQLVQAKQDVMSLGKEPFGKIVVGMPATLSPIVIAPLLKTVRRSMPNVSPHVIEAMSGFLLEWLHDGRLDAAILFDVQDTSGLNKTVIGVEPMYLVGQRGAFPKGSKIPFAELSRYPLIIPGRLHGIHMLIRQAAARQNVDLDIRVEVDAVAEMIDLVKQGLGYTVLARMGFHRDLINNTVSYADIVGPPMQRTLIIATLASRPEWPALTSVLHEIADIVGEFIEKGAVAPSQTRGR